MERLDNLISEIHDNFNEQWFKKSRQLFYDYPGNSEKKETIKFSQLEEQGYTQKEVNLYDFLFGVRDELADEIHDENELEGKLKQVGENDFEAIPNKTIKLSHQFYPDITYQEYENEIFMTLTKMINSVVGFEDKTKIIAYARSLLSDAIQPLKMDEFIKHNNRFINDIILKIDSKYIYLEEVNEVLSTNQTFLKFNLSTAQLAKFYQYFFDNGILLTEKKDFLNFASTFFKVMKLKNVASVKSSSLDTEIKSLKSKNEEFENWKKNQDFEI